MLARRGPRRRGRPLGRGAPPDRPGPGDEHLGAARRAAPPVDAVAAAGPAAPPRSGRGRATSISVLHAPPSPPFPELLQGTPVVHLALASPEGADRASALRASLASVPPAGV